MLRVLIVQGQLIMVAIEDGLAAIRTDKGWSFGPVKKMEQKWRGCR